LPPEQLNDAVGKKMKALHVDDFIAEKDQSVRVVVVKKLFILLTDHLPHFLFVLFVEFACHVISIPDGPLEDDSAGILCVLVA
jgi:hypothetical protein